MSDVGNLRGHPREPQAEEVACKFTIIKGFVVSPMYAARVKSRHVLVCDGGTTNARRCTRRYINTYFLPLTVPLLVQYLIDGAVHCPALRTTLEPNIEYFRQIFDSYLLTGVLAKPFRDIILNDWGQQL